MCGFHALPLSHTHPDRTPRMTTRLTWLGHGAWQVETAEKRVLIDPFLTGNPAAAADPDELAADFILVSHGHGDHVGDTVGIAVRTGATVISNFEIATWVEGQIKKKLKKKAKGKSKKGSKKGKQ